MKNPMSWTKRISFYSILVLLILVFVEVVLIVGVKIFIPDERNDPATVFNGVGPANDDALGWVLYDGNPRPTLNYTNNFPISRACVFVFGDSFSHSDEVSNKFSWASILEQKLGCPVANFGVGGYGTDQAYLSLVRNLPNNAHSQSNKKVVLFGVYEEMLRRNMAASWLFYCCKNEKKMIKPYFVLNDNGEDLVEHAIPLNHKLDDIKKHHNNDRYYSLYRLEFPYIFTLIKNIKLRLDKKEFDRIAIEPSGRVFGDRDAALIQHLLMKKVIEVAHNRGYTVGFIFFPTPASALNDSPSYRYSGFIDSVHDRINNNAFIIDLHPALNIATKKIGLLKAPLGHYNERGNEVIANHIYTTLVK